MYATGILSVCCWWCFSQPSTSPGHYHLLMMPWSTTTLPTILLLRCNSITNMIKYFMEYALRGINCIKWLVITMGATETGLGSGTVQRWLSPASVPGQSMLTILTNLWISSVLRISILQEYTVTTAIASKIVCGCSGGVAHHCINTGYVNNWHQRIHYRIRQNQVITGVYSCDESSHQ